MKERLKRSRDDERMASVSGLILPYCGCGEMLHVIMCVLRLGFGASVQHFVDIISYGI